MGLNIKELEKAALAVDPKDPLYSHIRLSIKVVDVINLLSVLDAAKEACDFTEWNAQDY